MPGTQSGRQPIAGCPAPATVMKVAFGNSVSNRRVAGVGAVLSTSPEKIRAGMLRSGAVRRDGGHVAGRGRPGEALLARVVEVPPVDGERCEGLLWEGGERGEVLAVPDRGRVGGAPGGEQVVAGDGDVVALRVVAGRARGARPERLLEREVDERLRVAVAQCGRHLQHGVGRRHHPCLAAVAQELDQLDLVDDDPASDGMRSHASCEIVDRGGDVAMARRVTVAEEPLDAHQLLGDEKTPREELRGVVGAEARVEHERVDVLREPGRVPLLGHGAVGEGVVVDLVVAERLADSLDVEGDVARPVPVCRCAELPPAAGDRRVEGGVARISALKVAAVDGTRLAGAARVDQHEVVLHRERGAPSRRRTAPTSRSRPGRRA